MRIKSILYLVLVCLFAVAFLMVAGVTLTALAEGKEPSEPESSETGVIPVSEFGQLQVAEPGEVFPNAPLVTLGQEFVQEVEPNDLVEDATPLSGMTAVALGNIFPNGDVDYYSFVASAGDRVYAAVMTAQSSNGSTDSQLTILDTEGSTVLEFDEDDGTFGSLSSSIAGTLLPATGTYYVKVNHFNVTGQLRPYHLHVRVQSGAPAAEVEPNDATPQALPSSGWIAGETSALTDVDLYSLDLNAGDTVFLSLDLDPERDAVEWNAQLGLGTFNGFVLVANDAGAAGPDSEAFFMTVKETGTYWVYVGAPGGGTTFGTYHLSASVHPAAAQSCTTYTSTDVPVAIPDGPGLVSSDLTVPGSPRVGDLNLTLNITHANMPDLDVVLTSPAGNVVGLFTDIGSNIQTGMDLGLDDEAGIPVGLFTVLTGMVNSTETAYSLDWFDGVNAGGTWRLDVYDDLAANGGTLNSWSISVCEPSPAPSCPLGMVATTVYASDFETDGGGFTHSGNADEWERGVPVFAPLASCHSGASCWKTDLDNTYNADSDQILRSPQIDLAGYSGAAWVTWAQASQMESATFDNASVMVEEVGGLNERALWQWLGATQTNIVGNPPVTLQESRGWGLYTQDISEYLGTNIELNFHLDSDSTVQLAGLAVDDVSVTACLPGTPAITLEKTVGTDPMVCASTDTVTVAPGTEVTYCYEVTNTGDISLGLHDLVDSELGAILNDFPYTLMPGASAFLTQTATIADTTVNTATWTAFNPGPMNEVSAEDSATVYMVPGIEVAPAALASLQGPDMSLVSTLTITNTGDADLSWSLVEMPGTIPAFVASSPVPDETPALPGETLSSYQEFNLPRPQALPQTVPVAPARPTIDGLVYYSDPAVFGMAFPGLPVEDFEEGNVAPNSVAGCPAPLDETSNNACFTPGQILPGVRFQDNPGPTDPDGLVLVGEGFNGNPSKSLVANIFVDSFDIYFTTPDVFATGMYLHSHYLTDTLTVTLYGLDGITVIESTTAQASPAGSFWGVAGHEPIGRINLYSPTNQAEGVDNLSFGNICSSSVDLPWVYTSPITGTVPGRSSAAVDVTFDSTGLGAGEYTGALCLFSNAPANPFISIPLTLTVSLEADLALTKTAPAEVAMGGTITYTLEVENLGPAIAEDVVLTDELPLGMVFASASPGCSEAGGVVTCNLGDLPPGITTVEIVASAPVFGYFTNTGEVAASSPDPDESNNSSAASTQVGRLVFLPVMQVPEP
jgi:uncharacterized repeat protein (TIGR01451 family)